MPLSEYLQQQAENFAIVIDNGYKGTPANDRVKVAYVKLHELDETTRAFLNCVFKNLKQLKQQKENTPCHK